MGIKTVYITSDGREFTDKALAEKWESKQADREFIYEVLQESQVQSISETIDALFYHDRIIITITPF